MDIETMFEEIAPDTSGMSLDQMIREFVRLDKRVKEAAYERDAYKSALIQSASEKRNGQNTVHLETADESIRVKAEFKRKTLCDQEEIECAKELLTEEKFRDLFRVEYSPKARNLKKFLNTIAGDERTETAKEMIKEAVKEADGTTYLSVEKS